MQRIAAAETKYAWWSITTSLLLASELKEDSNPGLILSIAERTLELCENGRKGDQKGKGKENEGLRFQSIETFHLVARMLELRVLTQDQSKVNIITKAETNDSPTRLFLQHFSSGEGKTWCERGLGLEIWRRESELQYGSLKGGEWNESWNRLRQSLEAGCVSLPFIVLSMGILRLVGGGGQRCELAYDAVPYSHHVRHRFRINSSYRIWSRSTRSDKVLVQITSGWQQD